MSTVEFPKNNDNIELHLTPFQKVQAGDICNMVSSIAAPIFLIISLSLATFYGIHPLGPMIAITPNFSLALPVVICGSMGVTSAFIFFIQIFRKKSVLESYERGFGQIIHDSSHLQRSVEFIIQPGGRPMEQTVYQYMVANTERINYCMSLIGPIHKFRARDMQDNMYLRGYWFFKSEDAPTVIIFHGNAMTAEQMAPNLGNFYKGLGFNVLLAEYRNYGISECGPAETSQEMGAYLDAEAALQFVIDQEIDRDKIVVHGYSLGGAYAAALGGFYDIRHVILDHTFTSIEALAAHVASLTPGSAASLVDATYKIERMDPDLKLKCKRAKPLITDGFNSLNKVAKMSGHTKIFVIRGEKDELMAPEFALEFLEGQYGKDEKIHKKCLATVPGGHCDIRSFLSDREAQKKLLNFFENSGLVIRKEIEDSTNNENPSDSE